MSTLFKSLVAVAAFSAVVNIAHAEKLNENIPEDMSCKEFVDMNPKAMTPVAFWIINKDTNFSGGDYVDWRVVDTVSVPKLIDICKKSPESKLKQWINDLK